MSTILRSAQRVRMLYGRPPCVVAGALKEFEPNGQSYVAPVQ